MIGVIGRAIYWTIGAVQAALELVGVTRRLVKDARSGKLPHDLKVDDTDPIPLSRPKPPLRRTGPVVLKK